MAYQHPTIAEAAVVGLPHERYGEEVGIVIAFNQSVNRTSVEVLRKFLGDRLAAFKVPTRWFAWPESELPRGATGKIVKRVMKDRILNPAREFVVPELVQGPHPRGPARL